MLTINYSFVTLGALIDLARAFIFLLKLSTAPPFRSLASCIPFQPHSVDGASIFRLSWMVCGPSSLRSRSLWKYLRLEPFGLSRALHDLSFSRPSPASTLFRHSLHSCLFPPFHSTSRRFFFFLSRVFFSIPLTLGLRPLVRKVVIGPSATSDRGGKQPAERTPRTEWERIGGCAG